MLTSVEMNTGALGNVQCLGLEPGIECERMRTISSRGQESSQRRIKKEVGYNVRI